MNGTAVGLVIGLAYGAVLGVAAYRWYAREREAIHLAHQGLQENVRSLARELHALKHPEVVSA